MNKENLLTALTQNFKLTPHLTALTKEMIDKAKIEDYEMLLSNIFKSDKFDFLSKLNEALEKAKQSNKTLDDEKIEEFANKIVDKCRLIAITAYRTKPDGLNFQLFSCKARYDMFKNQDTQECLFNQKEIKLLESVGGCYRWLNDYDDNKFLLDLISSIHRFKSEDKQKLIGKPTETNKKVLELIRKD